MTKSVDALVIGGGPAGSTAALFLARAGWSVLVLERKPFPRRKVCGEYLSATNLPLFDQLRLGESFRSLAGPAVQRVGLFAGRCCLHSDLPKPDGKQGEWGRALSREHLDVLLLDHAREAGAEVWQPATALSFEREGDHFHCQVRQNEIAPGLPESEPGLARIAMRPSIVEVQARFLIAAHGSWDAGSLPTQPPKLAPAPGDLLAFKAHFTQAQLPAGLMPLLAFPGGYGGMVHADHDQVSLSCCIRRDRLESLRRQQSQEAGEVVLAHIRQSCLGVDQALQGSVRSGSWLASGPIRPGIRLPGPHGVFPVGNAAGEAHPIVAEGISMAMQSSWLLTRRILAHRPDALTSEILAQIGNEYAREYRQQFSPRLRTAQILAAWAMRPAAVAGMLPILRLFPIILNWGARLSGKDRRVIR